MSNRMMPFYIIDILEEHTDENNTLLPVEIMRLINSKYGENTVKKTTTIVDNINEINDFYYGTTDNFQVIPEIIDENNARYKNNKRYFLSERKFDLAEILTIYNLLLNSRGIAQKEINELCYKMKSYLSKYQRKILEGKILTDGSSKTTNRSVYINLEQIQESIVNKQNIEFTYNEFNLEKKLVPRIRDYKYIVSPYGVVCSKGNYYLIGHHLPNDARRTYRIDKITNIKIDDENSYKIITDEDLNEHIKNSVFMHIDKNKIDVKLRCENRILDDIIESFENCRLSKDKDSSNHFFATIPDTTSLGMKYWILEYSSACEVIKPKELREDVKNTLKKALNWYED